MKTLKILNYGLLVFAGFLAGTAGFAFVNGKIILGICNILWMGCEVLFFLINKKSIEIKQGYGKVYDFLSAMDDTIEKYGSAIITEDEDGYLIGYAKPSCSAENNDNIEFVHNAEGGKE